MTRFVTDSSPATPSAPASASACARCGAAFTCGMVAGTQQCWCAALPRLQTLLPFDTCLCPACLEQALKDFNDAGTAHPPGRHP